MKETESSQDRSKEGITPQWEQIEQALSTLTQDQTPMRAKILQSFFKVAAKIGTDKHGTLSLKIATTVLKELRFSFKIFYAHRQIPKITMFGSARVPQGTPLYEFAKEFAHESARRNYMIITGGGPGIMAAGNEGAKSESGFGLNIRLPMEQSANPFIDSDKKLIHYKYFFTRKLFLVKEACAFAFFPGGFGTFDEAFEVLTLLQTGKTNMIPIVMMEPKDQGYWTGVSEVIDKVLMKQGFISPQDKSLYRICHSIQEGLDHIDHFYKNYHSMRLVRERLVIRMKQALTPKVMTQLNSEFGFLAQGEKIVQGTELTEEQNEPELKHLPRLIFPFARTDYGNLRRLVDFINDNTL